jgi:hypothetical protein
MRAGIRSGTSAFDPEFATNMNRQLFVILKKIYKFLGAVHCGASNKFHKNHNQIMAFW